MFTFRWWNYCAWLGVMSTACMVNYTSLPQLTTAERFRFRSAFAASSDTIPDHTAPSYVHYFWAKLSLPLQIFSRRQNKKKMHQLLLNLLFQWNTEHRKQAEELAIIIEIKQNKQLPFLDRIMWLIVMLLPNSWHLNHSSIHVYCRQLGIVREPYRRGT